MEKSGARTKSPPTVAVHAADESIDLRLWARQYVQLLFTIEGVALIPSTLERAS